MPKASLESVDQGVKRCLAPNWMLFFTLEPKFSWGASAANYHLFPCNGSGGGKSTW